MKPAVAAPLATTVTVYVYHRGSSKPTPSGELPPGTFAFGALQAAVVAAVEASGFFAAKFGREQLAAGDLYVVKEPTGEESEPPKLPGGRPLRPKPPAPIHIDCAQCVLLDVRDCEGAPRRWPACAPSHALAPRSAPSCAGVPDAAVAAGGDGGAAVALLTAKMAKLEAQHAAVDPELLPVLQKGLFSVLDLEGHPICCGFFVRESGVAITVNHDNEKFIRPGGTVRAAMLRLSGGGAAAAAGGVSAAAEAGALPLADEVLLEFKVHSFSPPGELDYTCLVLTSPVPPGTFQPLRLPPSGLPDSRLTGAHATLLHGSIALNRFFARNPSASLAPCTIFTAHPDRVLYTAATAGGDSGGALVLHGKTLVAMHVEGLNDVPDDLHVTSPREGKRPAVKLRLSEASPSTTGAALRLDLPRVQSAIAAAHATMQPATAAGGGGAA